MCQGQGEAPGLGDLDGDSAPLGHAAGVPREAGEGVGATWRKTWRISALNTLSLSQKPPKLPFPGPLFYYYLFIFALSYGCVYPHRGWARRDRLDLLPRRTRPGCVADHVFEFRLRATAHALGGQWGCTFSGRSLAEAQGGELDWGAASGPHLPQLESPWCPAGGG